MRILLVFDTLTITLMLTVAQTPWLPTCRGKQGYLFIGSYLSKSTKKPSRKGIVFPFLETAGASRISKTLQIVPF